MKFSSESFIFLDQTNILHQCVTTEGLINISQSFQLKISSVNATKSTRHSGFGHIY